MSKIKIASVQMNSETMKTENNLKRMTQYIIEAAENGAKLIILPEAVSQGYIFNSSDDAYKVAEEIPNGSITKKLERLAIERDIYIIAGLFEKENNILYNSAVFVGPEGYIGKYRKCHLWSVEKPFCDGGSSFPVFNTKLGKIGIMICFDLWFPEVSRLLTLQGADLICTPAGWVKGEGDSTLTTMPNTLCIANAHCNGVYIAAAVRVGNENGVDWVANSIIVSPTGKVLAHASDDKEEIIYAEVDLRDAKLTRSWDKNINIITSRRHDLYDEMLGYNAKAYPN